MNPHKLIVFCKVLYGVDAIDSEATSKANSGRVKVETTWR